MTIVQNWIYCLRPAQTLMDGELATKEWVSALSETLPDRELCLAARRYMEPGDRVWFYFATPVREIAALAEVRSAPYELPGGSGPRWKVAVALDPHATSALCDQPVPLVALANQHPQGVFRATAADLALLEAHAGLRRERAA
ncbi:EVE domain-containing protein [Streptomyces candidus]|uniref:EVE domain-containing protein n=1 Tax=Streptomyces candidus TaxID=67283 RepID=A0A7X0HKV8_9ACTN|nr:EVE domain-containing protein [Streptomyces candidus]MBB6439353.1 hypothetical protein [Streptomyces candidus]